MASPQKEEAELLEAQLAQRSGELAPTPALDTRPRDTSSGPQAVKALVDDKVSGADESSKTSSSVAVLFDASVQQQPLVTLWYFWTLPGFKRLRRAMRAGLGLTLLNQLTGINTVMLFGATVVQGMGYSLHAAIWATVLLCLTQAVGVFIAVWQIDGAGGRRFVALRSCALMCLSLVLLSASASTTATSFTSSDQDKGKFNIQSLAMPALLLYLFAFGVGLSPLCWVYNVEVYPTSARNLCSDQAFLLNIACTSLVSSSFLPMKNAIGLGGVFAMFGAVAAIGGIFVYLYLDETAGKTLEELEQEVLRSTSTSNAASGEENEALLQQYSFSGKRK
ncbi:unnamed protein product [Amoebophrya sp. A25]|nr:unnamed protein product [Amoebophrya sp. A25]|eukprot:GSA25T00010838001.1